MAQKIEVIQPRRQASRAKAAAFFVHRFADGILVRRLLEERGLGDFLEEDFSGDHGSKAAVADPLKPERASTILDVRKI